MSFRLVKLGSIQRKEYYTNNRCQLFYSLPEGDLAEEQKKSYEDFLSQKLPSLLRFYFPIHLQDYNNEVSLEILGEPKIEDLDFSEKAAIEKKINWENKISLLWLIKWHCKRMQFEKEYNLERFKTWLEIDERQKEGIEWDQVFNKIDSNKPFNDLIKGKGEKSDRDLEKARKVILKWIEEYKKQLNIDLVTKKDFLLTNLTDWIKQSFKINEFTLQQLEKNRWEAQTKGWKLTIWITPESEDSNNNQLEIRFDYEQEEETNFCNVPKMNQQGNFVINGHYKVVIFQSVRSPGSYFLQNEKGEFYGEIIPSKGSWVRLAFEKITSGKETNVVLRLKFLNSGSVISLSEILESYLSEEELINLLGSEEIITNSWKKETKIRKKKANFYFLFDKENSYFLLGQLGRKKFNHRMNIFQRVRNQTLAENLKDKKGKIILSAGTILMEEQIQVLQQAITKNDWKPVKISQLTDCHLYLLKIKAPDSSEKVINVLGLVDSQDEKKNYFDLEDFLSFLSYFLNLQFGLGKVEKEEIKDWLQNQVVRGVGDLLYNILDSRLGIFRQTLESKYIAAISHRLKKINPAKFPKIQEFQRAIHSFFNSSTLSQLQNQSPLGSISHNRKVTSLGLGGFSMSNVSLNVRNNNPSYYGLYDLVETPEGQKVGLVHSLTLNSKVNQYGQLIAPYFPIEKGKVQSKVVYLTEEEAFDKRISHPSIMINEKNQIEEKRLLVRHQHKFIWSSLEEVDYIDSSFYHLNSVNSANISFFSHNDSARMLMAANMQKQALVLLRGESPLVGSGTEEFLLNNSFLSVRSLKEGKVDYVDSEKIVIGADKYPLEQFTISNTNNLLTSFPLVKKGEKVKKNQLIAAGNHSENGELAIGHNPRIAFMIWKGYNFEDAIIVSKKLVEEDLFTSLFAKKYFVVRQKVRIEKDEKGQKYKYQEEEFYPRSELNHLDSEGIVKVGSEVRANDILVSKKTPYKETSTEEMLLSTIIWGKKYSFRDSSFRLPKEIDEGIITAVHRRKIIKKESWGYSKDDLEILEIHLAQKRKLQVGDKLTSLRFASKGIVGKIVPVADMPFDEEGNPIDMICNPLSIPSRMNIGQLIEALFSLVAHKTKTKLLVRPFNTPDWKTIENILIENQIKNHGLIQLYDGLTGLPFKQKTLVGFNFYIKLSHEVRDKLNSRSDGPRALFSQQPTKGRSNEGGQRVGEMEGYWTLGAHKAVYTLLEMMGLKSDDINLRQVFKNRLNFKINLQSNNSESFNLLLQYLRGIGFNLSAVDYQDRPVDFYKQFSKISP